MEFWTGGNGLVLMPLCKVGYINTLDNKIHIIKPAGSGSFLVQQYSLLKPGDSTAFGSLLPFSSLSGYGFEYFYFYDLFYSNFFF